MKAADPPSTGRSGSRRGSWLGSPCSTAHGSESLWLLSSDPDQVHTDPLRRRRSFDATYRTRHRDATASKGTSTRLWRIAGYRVPPIPRLPRPKLEIRCDWDSGISQLNPANAGVSLACPPSLHYMAATAANQRKKVLCRNWGVQTSCGRGRGGLPESSRESAALPRHTTIVLVQARRAADSVIFVRGFLQFATS